MSDELMTRMDRLESRHQIEALVSNYCHGFDKRDYERFLSIWWDDCVWKIGPPFERILAGWILNTITSSIPTLYRSRRSISAFLSFDAHLT